MVALTDFDSSQFEGVIYDFDGVLADTITAHTEARLEAFRRVGERIQDERLAGISDEIHNEAHRHGSSPQTIIGWILVSEGIVEAYDDPLVSEIINLKRDLYHEAALAGLRPIEGAIQHFKQSISQYGVRRVAIATTAQRREVTAYIATNNLEDISSGITIVCDEDARAKKPDPEVYNKTIEAIGVSNKALHAIEDSPRGVQSAKRAGLYTVALLTTHNEADFTGMNSSEQPDFITASFQSLSFS